MTCKGFSPAYPCEVLPLDQARGEDACSEMDVTGRSHDDADGARNREADPVGKHLKLGVIVSNTLQSRLCEDKRYIRGIKRGQ